MEKKPKEIKDLPFPLELYEELFDRRKLRLGKMNVTGNNPPTITKKDIMNSQPMRERLTKFLNHTECYPTPDDEKDFYAFVEQEIQLAKEEMRQECIEAVDRWDGGYPSNHSTGPKFCFTPEIKEAIQSLN